MQTILYLVQSILWWTVLFQHFSARLSKHHTIAPVIALGLICRRLLIHLSPSITYLIRVF